MYFFCLNVPVALPDLCNNVQTPPYRSASPYLLLHLISQHPPPNLVVFSSHVLQPYQTFYSIPNISGPLSFAPFSFSGKHLHILWFWSWIPPAQSCLQPQAVIKLLLCATYAQTKGPIVGVVTAFFSLLTRGRKDWILIIILHLHSMSSTHGLIHWAGNLVSFLQVQTRVLINVLINDPSTASL